MEPIHPGDLVSTEVLPSQTPHPRRKPSALYRLSRSWHEWLGLVSAVLICLIALSGIYLNHRDLFTPSPSRPAGQHGERPKLRNGAITLQAMVQNESLPRALDRVTQEWGSDAPLEGLTLRRNPRGMVWQFRSSQGRELQLDAQTLQVLVNRQGKGGADLTKIIHDLHTGQIVGMAGKIIVDLVALSMVILTVTGLILWIKPRIMRRRNQALA